MRLTESVRSLLYPRHFFSSVCLLTHPVYVYKSRCFLSCLLVDEDPGLSQEYSKMIGHPLPKVRHGIFYPSTS